MKIEFFAINPVSFHFNEMEHKSYCAVNPMQFCNSISFKFAMKNFPFQLSLFLYVYCYCCQQKFQCKPSSLFLCHVKKDFYTIVLFGRQLL